MLRLQIALLAAYLLLQIAPPAHAAAGTDFDLQGFIDRAIKAGHTKIVVPPGQYRVAPQGGVHLKLRNLKDIQILCDNVEMICTQTCQAVGISHCSNVWLRGLTVDYDPLPFSQGKVTALTPDKHIADVELFEGYPGADSVGTFKYEIYRPDTRTLREDRGDASKVDMVDDRHVRVTGGGGRNSPVQIGDIVTLGASFPKGAGGHAFVIDNSANVKLDNIDLFASPCFGFLEFDCDSIIYKRCRVDRRPAATDPVHRGDPRIRSLDADAFHSSGALKGPSLIDCVARFMGDDAVNIHGSYQMITACNGAELRVLINGARLKQDEPVEMLTYQGVRLPDAVVTKVEPDNPMTPEEHAFLLKQAMDRGLKNRTYNAYKITLDRAVELPVGSLICSTKRIGNGFLVQGCDFGPNRSRGILIKASDGQVIGNKLTGNWGEAIKVSPEYWWLESGSSINVVIKDNVISDCITIPIAVYANGGTGKIAPAGAHRSITISHNTISSCLLPYIAVTSTDGLVIEDNRCILAPDAETHWAGGMLGLDRAKAEAIMTTECANVTIKDNKIEREKAPQ